MSALKQGHIPQVTLIPFKEKHLAVWRDVLKGLIHFHGICGFSPYVKKAKHWKERCINGGLNAALTRISLIARNNYFFTAQWSDLPFQPHTCPMKSVKKSMLQRKAVHPSR